MIRRSHLASIVIAAALAAPSPSILFAGDATPTPAATTPTPTPAATPAPAEVAKADVVPVFHLEGSLPDTKQPLNFFGQTEDGMTFRQMVLAIRRAKTDPKVQAIVLKMRGTALGMARTMELHDVIVDFRASGKKVYAWYDAAGLGQYVLSTAADEIVIPPVSGLELTGMRANMFYLKNMLAKIGVQGEVVNTGRFKTAFDMFVRDSMSEGERVQMTELLGDLFDEMAERVAKTRDVRPVTAKRWLMSGPYTASQALDLGLVDRIAYYPELKASIEKESGRKLTFDDEYRDKPKTKRPAPNFFQILMGGGQRKKEESDKAPKIAVVYALGAISDGRAETGPFGGSDGIYSEDMIDTLNEVLDAENVKAVVLRVDSPGGSAIASDVIWERIEAIQAKGIPVVASMGNVAASGGYYISMGADRILAEPTTITGSIGVIGGRLTFGGTYQMLGVNKDYVAIGENSGLYDESRFWTDRERELINKSIEDIYETFTRKVAEGRKMRQSRVKQLGGGRVWSGVSAKRNGLVDELGGLERSIEVARELGKAGDAKVVTFPAEKDFMQILEKILGGDMDAQLAAGSAIRSVTPTLWSQFEQVLPPMHRKYARSVITQMADGKPKVLLLAPAVGIE